MTCRQYGAQHSRKENNTDHPIYILFNTTTNTIRKHGERGKISDDLKAEALKAAADYRDKALMDNAYAAGGYERDMKLDALYRKAEKRLAKKGAGPS